MSKLKPALALAMSLMLVPPPGAFASSHREAPITALDHKADITDFYAFVSYDHPDRVTFIMNVDPFLEPSNGPNYFPFDPNVLYEMKIDNNHDGLPDVTFQFQFKTQVQNPGLFTGFVGGLPNLAPITALTGPGSEGLNLLQTYSVTMLTGSNDEQLNNGQTLYAVPTDVGRRESRSVDGARDRGRQMHRHDRGRAGRECPVIGGGEETRRRA